MAQIVLDMAAEIGGDPRAGLVDKVVAWQAVHRVRTDLPDRARLADVQRQLIRGLEDLGDPAAAYEVAETALAEYLGVQPGEQHTPERDDLSASLLRLARIRQSRHDDALIDATIAAAIEGGAAIGLEARIWAAIDLLDQPSQRERALELTSQITTELNDRDNLGAIGNQWRLLLAFHTGQAGYPASTQQLLTPMLAPSSPSKDQDAARAVLYAVGGQGADTRLQIVGLEAELAALLPDADDDRLRIHHALAAGYGRLGDYRRALHHGRQELPLRQRIQGVDHPDALATRNDIAFWTGECGRGEEALNLFQELLPDMDRILGPNHPNTLTTRNNIAYWTGQLGHLAEALRLFQELLPDQVRILGPNHRETLTSRSNIAAFTGESGHPAEALRLYQELLPDQVRILGPDHRETLSTGGNIAAWTGESGHPTEALRLFQELLPDRERILGPDHPDTLRTRSNIAFWTGESGHPAEALRLYQKLLRDRERVLGPDHPDTLRTRRDIERLSTPGTPTGG